MKRLVFACMAGIFPAYILLFTIQPCRAGSATWLANPQNGFWDNSANWTAGGPPNGPSDVATFATTQLFPPQVAVTVGIQVNGITFNSGAPGFDILVTSNNGLTVSGVGITNNSAVLQTFTVSRGCNMFFANGATAIFSGGSATYFTKGGETSFAPGGQVVFQDNSTAAFASFGNLFGVNGGRGGLVTFSGSSTAGHGDFDNRGNLTSSGFGGETDFFDNSSADHGTFTNEGGMVQFGAGGVTMFSDSSTAGNAVLIANDSSAGGSGGQIFFRDDSKGGASQIKVFGNGFVDFSGHNFPGVGIGSIEGTGYVFLGNLQVGTNNLSTSFSGSFQDFGQSGSLTKVGTGTLTFEGNATNDYIADTTRLNIGPGSTINLNFSGDPDKVVALIINGAPQLPGTYGSTASGASNQLPQFSGTGQLLVTGPVVVSRKMQAAAAFATDSPVGGADFDLYLPLSGSPGVECRRGGAANDYQVVFNFLTPVTFTGAQVASGSGMVTSATGSGTITVTVNLTGVTNGQMVTIRLSNLSDGMTTSDLNIDMGVLVGDVTGNGVVNATDVSQTKEQSGALVTSSNFREDVTGNGAINSSDVGLVKLLSGSGLPAIVKAK